MDISAFNFTTETLENVIKIGREDGKYCDLAEVHGFDQEWDL